MKFKISYKIKVAHNSQCLICGRVTGNCVFKQELLHTSATLRVNTLTALLKHKVRDDELEDKHVITTSY